MFSTLLNARKALPRLVPAFLALLIFWSLPLSAVLTVAHAKSSPSLSRLTVDTPKGHFTFAVEPAVTDRQRQIGLMHRPSMPARSGMLFRFDRTAPVRMWMKNTLIPLDMIFADETGRISHIHYSATPHSLDIISSNGPVRFVLEVNAGEARAVGMAIGQTMQHPWFAASD